MEKTIISYQEEGIRLQLVKVENLEYVRYQIRKNRKIITNVVDENIAKIKMRNIIHSHVMQTHL